MKAKLIVSSIFQLSHFLQIFDFFVLPYNNNLQQEFIGLDLFHKVRVSIGFYEILLKKCIL